MGVVVVVVVTVNYFPATHSTELLRHYVMKLFVLCVWCMYECLGGGILRLA